MMHLHPSQDSMVAQAAILNQLQIALQAEGAEAEFRRVDLFEL